MRVVSAVWAVLRSVAPATYGDVVKALVQILTGIAGVYVGWHLNGKSQRRGRLRDTWADWAATVEECLGAARSFYGHGAPAIWNQKLLTLEVARTSLRAATRKLSLLVIEQEAKDEIRTLEGGVAAITSADKLYTAYIPGTGLSEEAREEMNKKVGKEVDTLASRLDTLIQRWNK